MTQHRKPGVTQVRPLVRSGEQVLFNRSGAPTSTTHAADIVAEWVFHAKDGDDAALVAWLDANEVQFAADATSIPGGGIRYLGTYICARGQPVGHGNFQTHWGFDDKDAIRRFEDEIESGGSAFRTLFLQFKDFIERADSTKPMRIIRLEPARATTPM